MKQRILITGGSGLLAVNWAFALCDRFSIILGMHKRNIVVSGVQTIAIDLESIDNLVHFFQKERLYAVIHAAGITNVEQCESQPDIAFHTNVTLASNVALACSIVGVKLVFISTDQLFSGGNNILADENQPTSPINIYGKTKVEAECQVIKSYPESLVIRTNFFGWGTSYRQSFSDFVVNALRTSEEITLFQDVFYTPILIEAVAMAVHDLINLSAVGIFNVVGDTRISKYCFGLKIAEVFGLDSRKIKPGLLLNKVELVQRPHEMSLSNKKTCNFLCRQLGSLEEQIIGLYRHELLGLAKKVKSL